MKKERGGARGGMGGSFESHVLHATQLDRVDRLCGSSTRPYFSLITPVCSTSYIREFGTWIHTCTPRYAQDNRRVQTLILCLTERHLPVTHNMTPMSHSTHILMNQLWLRGFGQTMRQRHLITVSVKTSYSDTLTETEDPNFNFNTYRYRSDVTVSFLTSVLSSSVLALVCSLALLLLPHNTDRTSVHWHVHHNDAGTRLKDTSNTRTSSRMFFSVSTQRSRARKTKGPPSPEHSYPTYL